MKPAHRPVEDWKAALTTLPDGPFFDLMRGYLGDIRTPFNKQRLVEDLASFLSRREVLETLASYLDETDRRVIAAVARLGEPTAGELATFFEGGYAFAELHGILLNLEERLILYRFRDGSRHRLALNPLVAPVLSPFLADPSLLFPSREGESGPPRGDGAQVRPGDLVLAAVLAFARGRRELFKADRTLKKKAQDEAERIFPGVDFSALLEALASLGILRHEEEGHRVDDDRVASLAALGPEDRRAYLAAGFLEAELGFSSGGRRPARERLQLWSRLIHALAADLVPGRLYPESTVHRLSDVLERSHGETRRRWDDGTDGASEFRGGAEAAVFRRALVAALLRAGILIRNSDGELGLWPAAAAGPAGLPGSAGSGESASAGIGFDSPFSCVLYPELPFPDAAALTRFCDVLEVGRTVRFGISRESAVRGFDCGMEVEEMTALLDRLSGARADQSLRWSLQEWRRRYAGIALYRGTVLVIEEERRYLAEAEGVAGLIARTLAPGVYLLSAAAEGAAVAALKRAGVDIVALPPEPSQRSSAGEGRPNPFPPPELPASRRRRSPAAASSAPAAAAPAGGPRPRQGCADPEACLAELRRLLDKKGLPKDQRDELAARIDRRLILSASQLVGAAVRYEKLEAKGLDYVGKVRVAEQALASASLVELFWRGPKGEPNRLLGTPAGLEKSGGELMLIIDPAPRGERLAVAIGKISLLRRIKRSIFGE